MQLREKIAIVTGAGRGIGRAIALTYANAGASVAIAERNLSDAQQVAAEIQALGRQAIAIETDVTSEVSVASMVQQTIERFGTIDILTTNAGIQRRMAAYELPLAEFQAILDVNLLGAFLCCKAVLPTLYAKREGTIVMIASDSGKHGYTHASAYCASKFGVLGFMESLADESRAYAVQVNAICPAGVKTQMSDTVTEADGRHLNTTHFMEPEEIADVALFLAGQQSRAIHSQSLQVYGGVDYSYSLL